MEEKAAVYCRLSQDDGSVGESGSIQTQRTLLTQYCKEQHISIADYTEFADEFVRQIIQKITVEDEETIRIHFRDSEMVIEQE